MSTEIVKYFENQEVRIVQDEQGDPWFQYSHGGSLLGHNTTTMDPLARHVEESDRRKISTGNFSNLRVEAWFINESGLYALIMGSHKPEARRFKHWVTSKVLPSIRRNAQYLQEKPALPATPSGLMAQVLAIIAQNQTMTMQVLERMQERSEARRCRDAEHCARMGVSSWQP